DTSNTPLEFLYEAADCKLFYTADMIKNVRLVWETAVDARWSNYKGCVAGSTNHNSSVGGGVKLPDGAGGGKARGDAGVLSVRDSAAALVVAIAMSVVLLVL